jgi:hypothetical protein
MKNDLLKQRANEIKEENNITEEITTSIFENTIETKSKNILDQRNKTEKNIKKIKTSQDE